MNKYQKMMSRYLKEMNPDMFEETDDPDIFKGVLSQQKIAGFQKHLDRMKEADEKEQKRLDDAYATGQDWKKALREMVIKTDNDLSKKKGMLSDAQNTSADKKLINLAKNQTKKLEKETSDSENISNDVAKDLTKEAINKSKDKGRGLKGYKTPSKQEKRGYKQDDGGNWSVDTKSKHWQTKEGYNEAIELYGSKPAWVKQPSLIYNPKTKSYDPIKVEKTKEVKPYKRISL